MPPGAGLAARGEIGKAVVVNHRANIARRGIGEWIAFDQPQHWARALQEAYAEVHHPGILPIGAQRGEPHLPIQSRLMRRNEPGPARDVARLVFELVLPPGDAILAALNDNLRARGGHYREQAVAVEAPERFQPPVNRDQWPRPRDVQAEHHRELQERRDDRDSRERHGELYRPLPDGRASVLASPIGPRCLRSEEHTSEL